MGRTTARLQKDVIDEEEIELRRLEAGVPSVDEEEAGDDGALVEVNSGAPHDVLHEVTAARDGVLVCAGFSERRALTASVSVRPEPAFFAEC